MDITGKLFYSFKYGQPGQNIPGGDRASRDKCLDRSTGEKSLPTLTHKCLLAAQNVNTWLSVL